MPLNSPSDLNPEKQKALQMLQRFVQSSSEQVFVLTGYAGTGKTTLVKFLAKWCLEQSIPLTLLASTGRAAKVLAAKTGHQAETVHRLIYSIDTSELDDENMTKKVRFRLTSNVASENRVYLIDESSMISDKPLTEQSLTLFGSGSLLSDIFTYCGRRKIIFVGDSAQLPPVNARFSPALDLHYLIKTFGVRGTAVSLTEVMRYGEHKGIFENAEKLQQVIRSQNYQSRLHIQARGHAGMHVFALDTQLLEHYVATFRRLGFENCILLALSNRLVSELNRQIRARLHGPASPVLVPGEILMVQQNNYKLNIANGEHVEVVRTTGPEETRAGLTFIPAELYVSDASGRRLVKAMLLKEFLEMNTPRLDNEAEYRLTADFIIRMKRKGIHPKRNAEEFTTFLLSDPYLNAVRARYGYAVTCHKAQGGEWPHVYIILEKGLWNPTDPSLKFKWTYTALTRSEKNLYFLESWSVA
ncbi:MAG: ATP-dependent RecD-like DNA helicase [Bacteroidales bacterium]